MTSALRHPPPLVTAVLRSCRAAGGRPFLVGGSVRDGLLGATVKDWDIEVFGLPVEALARALAAHGRVDEVGRSFGVLKLHRGPTVLDISVPRRDDRAGVGHRGIRATADPTMSPAEACRRRDLTINAMLYDPLDDLLIDPFGGAHDLEARCLRAVDPETFLEDPLRPLRVVQFAARFGFRVDPGLVQLGLAAPLHELPHERIEGEWQKLLSRAKLPSAGFVYAREAGILTRLFPEVADPPGLGEALDAIVPLRPEDPVAAYVWTLAAWLCRSPASGVTQALDRLGMHRLKGVPVRDQVVAACAHWQDPVLEDRDLRWLSTYTSVPLVLGLRHAWTGAPRDLGRVDALGLMEGPPAPLLRGRDLKGVVAPGPALGEALRWAYAAQLDGRLHDREGALAAVRARAS